MNYLTTTSTVNSSTLPPSLRTTSRTRKMMMGGMFTSVVFIPLFAFVDAFSTPSSSSTTIALFDRFRTSCPADLDAIRRFDPTLDINVEDDDNVWAAVFRIANNLPSVFVDRESEFFNAMTSATTTSLPSSSSSSSSGNSSENAPYMTGGSSSSSSGVMIVANCNENQTPVAIARLRKGDYDGNDGNVNNSSSSSSSYYCIMDAMRCSLRKEDTNPDCDGGSEHSEALGLCIDELVLAYLRGKMECDSFDGGIRFRGTLISGRLLSSRGFREVSDLQLSKDVRTSHESDVDGAMEQYSERMTSRLSPGARERASSIVSYLGRMDREKDKRRRRSACDNKEEDVVVTEEGENDFDPWASITKYL